MYNPTQIEVREFFFNILAKDKAKIALTDLEKMALSVILQHPEYNEILNNKDKYLTYQWNIDEGNTNPFLHLSMHLTLIEQISINQPTGIKDSFYKLCKKYGTEHEAFHQLIDCLGEMLWQAQKYKSAPDVNLYLDCINNKIRV